MIEASTLLLYHKILFIASQMHFFLVFVKYAGVAQSVEQRIRKAIKYQKIPPLIPKIRGLSIA